MLSDVFTFYGDVIPLKFDRIEDNIIERLSAFDNDWKQYNPKKPHIKRFGLSITSLDGKLTGYPDLDSVKEYNELHKVNLDENDFNVRTPVVKSSPSLENVLNSFSSMGRSHFLKFAPGGFFPFHRDGNFRLPATSFRVFSLAHGSNKDFVWLQENKKLHLLEKKWYVINTFKEHAVFSFTDTMITVLNVPVTKGNIRTVIDYMDIS